jgi:hypothetical protein
MIVQEQIKEYKDYGFSPEEIAKELKLDLFFVKSALDPQKKPSSWLKAKSLRYGSCNYDRKQANDKEMPLYEILYKYSSYEINKLISKLGFTLTSKYMGVKRNDLIALKVHFGFHNPIPRDALEHIAYFSNDLRKKVDERDERRCVRCGKKLNKKNIRYHKISHPGPMEVDNCITLCFYCRSWRILKHYDTNKERFENMRFEEFKKWIFNNDPAIKHNKQKS